MEDRRGISQRTKSGLLGLASVVIFSPVYFVVSHYSQDNRGLLAESVVIVFAGVAYGRSDLLRKASFLATLLVLFAAQFAAILIIKLPTAFPGPVMISGAIVDALLLLGIASLFGEAE
jgi:hypothetical protein